MAKRSELEERFLELRLEGKTYQAISEELGVSKQTLFNWSKDQNISNLMKFAQLSRLQAIARKYQLNREANLERYGHFIEKYLTELAERDLSEIPTDKLLKMALDLQKQIQNIIPPVQVIETPIVQAFGMGQDFEFDAMD